MRIHVFVLRIAPYWGASNAWYNQRSCRFNGRQTTYYNQQSNVSVDSVLVRCSGHNATRCVKFPHIRSAVCRFVYE